jgi:hypothetical protein
MFIGIACLDIHSCWKWGKHLPYYHLPYLGKCLLTEMTTGGYINLTANSIATWGCFGREEYVHVIKIRYQSLDTPESDQI